MKKILFMFALIMGVVSANAQIATQNSNAFDNISAGVTAGISTPFDFNSMFPINPNVGLKLQKNFSPMFGIQAEGLAILNDNHFTDIKTALKATNVGANGVFNLSNIFKGYKGTPRTFEVSTVTGLGWLHTWDTKANFLTAKTGLDFAFNLGKKKAISIVFTPAIYWNLNKSGKVKFNKHDAQLAVNASLIYHFTTSNGTHHFKTWDVGAMTNEIAYLNGKLDECYSREPITRSVEVPVEKYVLVNDQWFVEFAKNSAELDDTQKIRLNAIPENLKVDVVGTASPEGSDSRNKILSEERAAVVAMYLESRGVIINSICGRGVEHGDNTNRLVIITAAE